MKKKFLIVTFLFIATSCFQTLPALCQEQDSSDIESQGDAASKIYEEKLSAIEQKVNEALNAIESIRADSSGLTDRQKTVEKNVEDKFSDLSNKIEEALSSISSAQKSYEKSQKENSDKSEAWQKSVEENIKDIDNRVTDVQLSSESFQKQTQNDSASWQKTVEGTVDTIHNKVDESLTAVATVEERSLGLVKAGIVVCVIMVLLVVLACWLTSKLTKALSALKQIESSQAKLEREKKEIQAKLVEQDSRITDLLEDLTKSLPTGSASSEPDHSLVIKVADEIVRIKTNLLKMDPSVKGLKQLSKAIERIQNNFQANGYEIIDMIGQPYAEGMKATANFVTDENLPKGSQVITGAIKPQINYKGLMIQAAQINVSQNI